MTEPVPICKIAQETGEVPLACLFGCQRGNCMGEYADQMLDDYLADPFADLDRVALPRIPRCRNCGSTDVRWRQQTGKWVLFSTEPGKVHECRPPNADDFDVIDESKA